MEDVKKEGGDDDERVLKQEDEQPLQGPEVQ